MADFNEVESNQHMMGSNTDYSNHSEQTFKARFDSEFKDAGLSNYRNTTSEGAKALRSKGQEFLNDS